MLDKAREEWEKQRTEQVLREFQKQEKQNVIEVIEAPGFDDEERDIFTVVEDAPQFPGGEDVRIKFLQENLRYPQEAKKLGVQGTVLLTFVVEKDGRITDIRVLRGIGSGCDEEAIRVVRDMPKWIPAKQRGRAVPVQFNMPIRFTLPTE